MKDVVYRFRPIDRLLNDDGISGELDSLFMYFASPEQLNDPLEGYADLFFDGDEIAWDNLLRNYLQCLTSHCIRIAHKEDKSYDLSINALRISSTLTPETIDTCNRVIDLFTANTIIRKFLSVWHLGDQVSRNELFNYLGMIHFYAVDCVLKILISEGYISAVFRESAKLSSRLKQVEDFTNTLSRPHSDPKQKKAYMDEYVRDHQEHHLLDRYNKRQRSMPVLYYEMLTFPDKYCTALEKAVHPRWYVACFMEKCDDSSIWGSYGKNHTAVCLEFNAEKHESLFGVAIRVPTVVGKDGYDYSYKFQPFKAVTYDKAFANIDFFSSLGTLPPDSLHENWLSNSRGELSSLASHLSDNAEERTIQYWSNFYHSASLKTLDWSRERECRIILTSNLFDLSEPQNRKLHYQFQSLKGIIFGIKTPSEDKLRIINRIEKLCHKYKRSEFSFYQARYDDASRKIINDPLTKIKVGYNDTPTS